MDPQNSSTILPFLFTALTALSAFCGFLVKVLLQLLKENVSVMTEVKTGIKELSENVKSNTHLVNEHLIKGS